MIKPYYDRDGITIYHGDCLQVMPQLPAACIDAIVTDPPYGLAFMGKQWDYGIPGVPFWREAIRVAKPGAHLLAFGGTRTFHRLACAIEDAGWEIRDCIMWVYGSGFPKSLDVSKAIDKAAGAKRQVLRERSYALRNDGGFSGGLNTTKPRSESCEITAPATTAGRQWSGWGTALKPAWEPIIVARKPLAKTVAANVLAHGTGAINIDGCRVAGCSDDDCHSSANRDRSGEASAERRYKDRGGTSFAATPGPRGGGVLGRWPANLIHDGSDEVTVLFPVVSGQIGGNNDPNGSMGYHGGAKGKSVLGTRDRGSAARFFYTAKASGADRGSYELAELPLFGDSAESFVNTHPTVKPLALMRYLCRLVTPVGGIVLDPFCGSGTTTRAAKDEGFRAIGIELNAEYCQIIVRRMASPANHAAA